MKNLNTWALVGAVGAVLAATPLSAQLPNARGIVAVSQDVEDWRDGSLGFVAAPELVIAAVPSGMAASVPLWVLAADTAAPYLAELLNYDGPTGLGLLAVPGLAAEPYAFARAPARVGRAATSFAWVPDRDPLPIDAQDLRAVPGEVEAVDSLARRERGSITHTAVSPGRRNVGGPLLNVCGEVVGAVVQADGQVDHAEASAVAVPSSWLASGFDDLSVQTAAADCLSRAEQEARAAEQEARAAEQQARADSLKAAADSAIAAADSARAAADAARAQADSLAQAGRASDAARERARVRADSARAQAERDSARAAEAEQRADSARQASDSAQRAATELEEQNQSLEEENAATRQRILLVAVLAVLLIAVVGLVGVRARRGARREAARAAHAEQGAAQAEGAAQAARSALEERTARDRMAGEVPGVLLEGSGDTPVAVRVPGRTIANAGGAVVGRNPFESAVVLDHPEVSRKHFRLSASGGSVMIEDLRSTNGTVVDGVRLEPGVPVPLRDGSVLAVGGMSLVVSMQRSPGTRDTVMGPRAGPRP